MEGQVVSQIASASVLIGHVKQSPERSLRHESLKIIIVFIIYQLALLHSHSISEY